VEERARYELGMIKENEIFIQILDPRNKSSVVQVAAPLKPETKPVP
jgi:cell division protein FtsB